jgi:hypothetical protein
MKDNIAYCGLDCEKCDACLATVRDDDELRTKTAELWSKLNNYPIKKEMINCLGCRQDGVKTVFCESLCEIRKCAQKKNLHSCGDCEERHSCATLAEITASSPEAKENLEKNERMHL